MKLGDIKIEALKLMFANVNEDLYVDNLGIYERDETYRGYLVNMPGAINRCFASIEEKRVLPSKTRTLKCSDAKREECLTCEEKDTVCQEKCNSCRYGCRRSHSPFVRFDLADLISDFFDIDRIVMETEDGDYDGDCDYMTEGDTLVLEQYRKCDGITYTVIYKPTIPRVTATTSNNTDIAVPDNIAAYIPYFLKGDLYRDDEPNEASEARNWYEQAMSEIVAKQARKTNSVKSVYSQTE